MSINANFRSPSLTPGIGGKTTAGTAQQAKKALAKGVQDGGSVTAYKPRGDMSGANGIHDYFSALGYDA